MIVVMAIAILASCGGGGADGGGSPGVPSGSLSVSPAALSFSGFTDTTTSPENLTISDTASNSYSWSGSIIYQSSSGWLQLNGNAIAAGQTVPAQQVSVSVDNASLPIGVHSASIVILGNGKTVTIPVSYTLTAPPITFSPLGVVQTYSPGSTTIASQQVMLILRNPQGTPASSGTVLVSNANGSQIFSGWGPGATLLSPPVPLTADAAGIVYVTVNYSLGPVVGDYTVLEAWRDTAYKTFGVTLVCADPDLSQPPACP